MKLSELLARTIIVFAVLAVIGVPLFMWAHTPLIHARVPEDGGWSPDVLYARVGEPLSLHLTSDDVTHGFAVAGLPMQAVDVLPGKVTDVTLTFDAPGTYTFYSSRWSGINSLEMTGTIKVEGIGPAMETAGPPPLYVSLGLDLDAPHKAPLLPARSPSSVGAQSYEVPIFPNVPGSQVPIYASPEYYRSNSPYATWQLLRQEPILSQRGDQELWDMVAFVWQSNTTPQAVAAGALHFAHYCAACHGETGRSDGVYGPGLKDSSAKQGPADFTNAESMLGASPALLQGKILRGGLGTGMPSWRSIFTDEQMWELVAYLYSFQFEYH